MENKIKVHKKYFELSCMYSLSIIMLTGCITVDPPKEIYTAAMVNKSGQKITVKNVPYDYDIPDFFILAPKDSVSWWCDNDRPSKNMEIYFNDIFYKKYENQSSDWRDPRVLWHYEKKQRRSICIYFHSGGLRTVFEYE